MKKSWKEADCVAFAVVLQLPVVAGIVGNDAAIERTVCMTATGVEIGLLGGTRKLDRASQSGVRGFYMQALESTARLESVAVGHVHR
jgi:hypothetical protein